MLKKKKKKTLLAHVKKNKKQKQKITHVKLKLLGHIDCLTSIRTHHSTHQLLDSLCNKNLFRHISQQHKSRVSLTIAPHQTSHDIT